MIGTIFGSEAGRHPTPNSDHGANKMSDGTFWDDECPSPQKWILEFSAAVPKTAEQLTTEPFFSPCFEGPSEAHTLKKLGRFEARRGTKWPKTREDGTHTIAAWPTSVLD